MFVENIPKAVHAKLVTIGDDSELMEAAKLLTSGTDLVVVCDSEGIACGVVTKTDIVKQMSVCTGAACHCPVSTVMTRAIVVCREQDLLQDVSERMKARRLKNIPLVDIQNRPLAVLTARTVLSVLLGDLELEEAQLVDYVKGVGYR